MEDKLIVIDNSNKPKKHNYKLTEQDEKDICTSYIFNRRGYEETMQRYNISKRCYYDVINKHKKNNFEILNEDINEMRSNFTKRTTAIINQALDKIQDKLNNGEDINLSQLATLTGVLYDKEALELGKATSNSAFNINIKIDK